MATEHTKACPSCGKPVSSAIPAEDFECPNRPRYARGGVITGDAIDMARLLGFPPTPPAAGGATASVVVNVAILAAQSPVVTPAAYRQHVLGEWRS